jgi:hypothetical protein
MKSVLTSNNGAAKTSRLCVCVCACTYVRMYVCIQYSTRAVQSYIALYSAIIRVQYTVVRITILFYAIPPNLMVEYLAPLLRDREAQGSSLGSETGYCD